MSILKTCTKDKTEVIYCADWHEDITAHGHLVEYGLPIKDIRDADLSHQNLDCLGLFRRGERIVLIDDFGEFGL